MPRLTPAIIDPANPIAMMLQWLHASGLTPAMGGGQQRPGLGLQFLNPPGRQNSFDSSGSADSPPASHLALPASAGQPQLQLALRQMLGDARQKPADDAEGAGRVVELEKVGGSPTDPRGTSDASGKTSSPAGSFPSPAKTEDEEPDAEDVIRRMAEAAGTGGKMAGKAKGTAKAKPAAPVAGEAPKKRPAALKKRPAASLGSSGGGKAAAAAAAYKRAYEAKYKEDSHIDHHRRIDHAQRAGQKAKTAVLIGR